MERASADPAVADAALGLLSPDAPALVVAGAGLAVALGIKPDRVQTTVAMEAPRKSAPAPTAVTTRVSGRDGFRNV
ncbi:hypothetical protein ABT373_29140 [Streptomyces sp. NPDC000070]|uniref:hypothetical protein n=1 Tax=Streptomyces sp. NPDC000070 TaxID=3154240 RepID=UPI00331B88DB